MTKKQMNSRHLILNKILLVLIIFIPLMFVCTEQADVAHALFISLFAVRLLANVIQHRQQTVRS